MDVGGNDCLLKSPQGSRFVWLSRAFAGRECGTTELRRQPGTSSSTTDPATQTPQQTPAQTQPAAAAQAPATDKDNKSDKNAPDATGQGAGTSATPQAKPSGTPSATSNDRLVFALPNFLTVQNGVKLPPLSAKDKFKVVARGSFDYVNFGWYVVAGRDRSGERQRTAVRARLGRLRKALRHYLGRRRD